MLWFAVRIALGAYLLTRRHPGRATQFAGGLLLPGPVRSLAAVAVAARAALAALRAAARG